MVGKIKNVVGNKKNKAGKSQTLQKNIESMQGKLTRKKMKKREKDKHAADERNV